MSAVLEGFEVFQTDCEGRHEANSETTIYCSCLDCGNNKKYSDFEVVYAHLIIRGFVPNYTCWNKHGEEGPNERGEWVADNQEGFGDDDQDGEQGNCDDGQAYDDINEECILEFNGTSLMPWSTMLRR